MKILEAILAHNEAFLKNQKPPAACPATLAVLTCIDPRITPYLHSALGLSSSEVVWIRNAGNIVRDPLGDPLRSLALAIFLKGATEILVLGHSDCRLEQLEANHLLEAMTAKGVVRQSLGPVDLRQWVGTFHDVRKNVQAAVKQIRACPFLPATLPVHGMIMDTTTGALETLVNGYEAPGRPARLPDSGIAGFGPIPASPAGTAAEAETSRPATTARNGSRQPKGTAGSAPPPLPGPPAEKNLLDAVSTLRDFFTEIRKVNPQNREWLEIKQQLAAARDPFHALQVLEQSAGRLTREHPALLQACRLLRDPSSAGTAKSQLENLLRRLLNP